MLGVPARLSRAALIRHDPRWLERVGIAALVGLGVALGGLGGLGLASGGWSAREQTASHSVRLLRQRGRRIARATGAGGKRAGRVPDSAVVEAWGSRARER